MDLILFINIGESALSLISSSVLHIASCIYASSGADILSEVIIDNLCVTDEYSCWPGDHVVFKESMEKETVAVVQQVSTDRTAQIQLIGPQVRSHATPIVGSPSEHIRF